MLPLAAAAVAFGTAHILVPNRPSVFMNCLKASTSVTKSPLEALSILFHRPRQSVRATFNDHIFFFSTAGWYFGLLLQVISLFSITPPPPPIFSNFCILRCLERFHYSAQSYILTKPPSAVHLGLFVLCKRSPYSPSRPPAYPPDPSPPTWPYPAYCPIWLATHFHPAQPGPPQPAPPKKTAILPPQNKSLAASSPSALVPTQEAVEPHGLRPADVWRWDGVRAACSGTGAA